MTFPYKEMSPQEIALFLDAPRHAVVATNRKGKAPLLSPVWYLFDQTQLYFEVQSTSAKFQCLSNDPNISVCIDGDHPDSRAVTIYGTATVMRGSTRRETEIHRRIARRYLRNDEAVQRYLQQATVDDNMVLFAVTPHRIIARDYN